MTGLLSDLGDNWADLADHIADWSADLLRRAHAQLADGIDRAAQLEIEGARDWRNLRNTGDRYAD